MAGKVNPLFQDSSLSTGTNIRTQFEVKKVPLCEGDKVYLSLVDSGERKFIEMKCVDDKSAIFSCSAWLKHKKEIGYQFFIMNQDEVVQVTDQKPGIAMYTLLDVWETSENSKSLAEVSKHIQQGSKDAFVEDSKSSNSSSEDIIENLIEKWGL